MRAYRAISVFGKALLFAVFLAIVAVLAAVSTSGYARANEPASSAVDAQEAPAIELDEHANATQTSAAITTEDPEVRPASEAEAATVPILQAQGSTTLGGDVLDGATLLIRPAGSHLALSINHDGAGQHNVVHLYNIGASSRFHLERAESGSSKYRIHFYPSFDAESHRTGNNSILDIDGPSTKEGKVIHVVGDSGNESNKQWQFIQQDDGTYYIYSEYSNKYWSLEDTSGINTEGNKLCQRESPMKWEIEVVGYDTGASPKVYDSYNFTHDGNTVTALNWMRYLDDEAYLSDLTIPGVHDAATCHIGVNPNFNFYRCQQFSRL